MAEEIGRFRNASKISAAHDRIGRQVDMGCRCGAHDSELLWNDETRRAAGVALAAIYYKENAQIQMQLNSIIAAMPDRCDSSLARRLRAWDGKGRPVGERDDLIRALAEDAAELV